MAKDKIKGIQQVDPVEVDVGDGRKIEVAPGAVTSVTTEVPHPADASSAPGPYEDLDVNRPPVSTNDPETPIAHSLVAGAGAPTPEPEIHPETHVAANAYVTAADKDNLEPIEAPATTADKDNLEPIEAPATTAPARSTSETAPSKSTSAKK